MRLSRLKIAILFDKIETLKNSDKYIGNENLFLSENSNLVKKYTRLLLNHCNKHSIKNTVKELNICMSLYTDLLHRSL